MIFQFAPPSHIYDKSIANDASTGISFIPSGLVLSPQLPWWGAVFLLSSTSHPPQWFLQGSSPLSWSAPTACPGTPCRRSARQHTGLSDGPPGRGPSTRLWRRTPAGCPAGGAVEHRCNQSIILTWGKTDRILSCPRAESLWMLMFLCVSICVSICVCVREKDGVMNRVQHTRNIDGNSCEQVHTVFVWLIVLIPLPTLWFV